MTRCEAPTAASAGSVLTAGVRAWAQCPRALTGLGPLSAHKTHLYHPMLTLNFSPFPVLTTARLTLRRPELTDTAAYFPLRADAAQMRFIPRPVAKTPEDAAAVIEMMHAREGQREGINWALTRTGEDELLGVIGYVNIYPEAHRAEVGYILHPSCHGQGLMDEALKAVVQYGFEQMRLHSIEAITDPANKSSRKILERNGFVQEGFFKENDFFDGKYLDTVVYSRLTNHPVVS
jgi:[ribosomal protein S5]-alanine N-acetyltransferase